MLDVFVIVDIDVFAFVLVLDVCVLVVIAAFVLIIVSERALSCVLALMFVCLTFMRVFPFMTVVSVYIRAYVCCLSLTFAVESVFAFGCAWCGIVLRSVIVLVFECASVL